MSFLWGSSAPGVQQNTGEEYLQNPSQRTSDQAWYYANQPYQPYGGPRNAEFSQDQLDAFEATRQQQGIAGLGYNEAMDMTRGAAGPISGDEINYYMNPYMGAVADQTAEEMQRRYEMQRGDMRSDAAMTGAFGGGRHAMEEAEMSRNNERGISDMYTTQYSNAWNMGLGAAQADRARMMGAGQQLGQQYTDQQAVQYNDISHLGRVGEAQQDQTQRNYDTAYGDWESQRDWGKRQMDYMADIIAKLRAPGAGTQYQYQPKDGMFNQFAGLGIAALGSYFA